MEKEKTRKYEGVFVLPPNTSSEDRAKQEKALEEQVTKAGGKVLDRKVMGLRHIAYVVKKQREGYFLQWTIELSPSQVQGFARATQLNEHVLKYMLTIKDDRLDKKVVPPPKKETQEASARPYAKEVK